MRAVLITTSNDLPGYEVVAVQGEVFGLTVRSRNIGAGCLAAFRSLGGGEIPQFTKLLTQSRNEAMARMVEEAERRGANAIVAMRFDSGAIGQWSEICAYGTACTVNPLTKAAREQHEALTRGGGELPHQQAYATRISEWGRQLGATAPTAPPPSPPLPSPPGPADPGGLGDAGQAWQPAPPAPPWSDELPRRRPVTPGAAPTPWPTPDPLVDPAGPSTPWPEPDPLVDPAGPSTPWPEPDPPVDPAPSPPWPTPDPLVDPAGPSTPWPEPERPGSGLDEPPRRSAPPSASWADQDPSGQPGPSSASWAGPEPPGRPTSAWDGGPEGEAGDAWRGTPEGGPGHPDEPGIPSGDRDRPSTLRDGAGHTDDLPRRPALPRRRDGQGSSRRWPERDRSWPAEPDDHDDDSWLRDLRGESTPGTPGNPWGRENGQARN